MKGDDVTVDKWFGFDTIYGRDGEHTERYMTRLWVGRLRLHLFWRGDNDPDAHDHPWDFWTFPLRTYVEEVVERVPRYRYLGHGDHEPDKDGFETRVQLVKAFRLHYRPATHTHRVLGVWTRTGHLRRSSIHEFEDKGFMPTIVWRGRSTRKWGFLKNRDGEWCWTPWRKYLFEGGKDAPCQPGERP